MKHPLTDVPPDIIKAAVNRLGEAEREAFPVLLTEMLGLLRRVDPLQVMSTLAWYGLQAGVRADGPDTRGMLGEKISQHSVELVQALLLTLPREHWGSEIASPGDIQQAIDCLDRLTESFRQRRYVQAASGAEESRAASLLQEQIRIHTQVVRNWGYFEEVLEISTSLYSPLDDNLRGRHEFSAIDCIQVFHALIASLERRATERLKLLRRVMGQRSNRQIIRKYHDVIGAEGSEAFAQMYADKLSTRDLKALLLSHADLRLLEEFVVDTAALSAEANVSENTVRKILSTLAHSPGACADIDPERMFLSNPAWVKPVIELPTGQYVCFFPQAFFSHIHQIFALLLDDKPGRTALAARRSVFLEERMVRALRLAFPECQSWTNVKWTTDSRQYETDALLRIDGTLLIVEAKAGAVSAPALRGGIDRLKQHLKDLIFHPSEQAVRLERLIQRAQAGDPAAISSLGFLGTDPSTITNIVRLSVLLEELSILSSLERDYRELGWIGEDVKLSPCISIADFECITNLLPNEIFLIDYLTERSRLQSAMSVVADELDWLGLYIEAGLNFNSIETSTSRLIAVGMSKVVDDYFVAKSAGIKLAKPRPKIAPLWEGILTGVHQRKFPGWLEVGCALLRSGSFEEQREVAGALKKVIANVKRNWRNPDHTCALVMTPPPTRTHGVIIFVFPPQLSRKRADIASDLASKFFDDSTVDRCVVVGKRLDMLDAPYSTISVAVRPE